MQTNFVYNLDKIRSVFRSGGFSAYFCRWWISHLVYFAGLEQFAILIKEKDYLQSLISSLPTRSFTLNSSVKLCKVRITLSLWPFFVAISIPRHTILIPYFPRTGLSVLELYLLVCMKRLESKEQETYNFTIVFQGNILSIILSTYCLAQAYEMRNLTILIVLKHVHPHEVFF